MLLLSKHCSPFDPGLQKFASFGILHLRLMSCHLVISLLIQPGNGKTMVVPPVEHVVVLPAPAPELVGEPVDQLKMLPGQGSDPPKYCGVGHFVVEGGDPGRHVQGQLGVALVRVCLVHGNEVDVMEDGAGEVEILHRLRKADIKKHSPTMLLSNSVKKLCYVMLYNREASLITSLGNLT